MDSNELALLSQRMGHVAHWLVYVGARDRQDGTQHWAGFWTGDDDLNFTIGGQSRLYYGAGAALTVDPIQQEVGLQVRMQTIRLATVPDVEQAIKGYDPSLQPVEIHRATFEPLTMTLVAEPQLVFAGTVDGTPIEEGAIGGVGSVALAVASKVRSLTRLIPIMKSDAALKDRAGDDGFRKYVSEAGQWAVAWGEKSVKAKDNASGTGGKVPITFEGGVASLGVTRP